MVMEGVTVTWNVAGTSDFPPVSSLLLTVTRGWGAKVKTLPTSRSPRSRTRAVISEPGPSPVPSGPPAPAPPVPTETESPT
jgi:hypothetical protein